MTDSTQANATPTQTTNTPPPAAPTTSWKDSLPDDLKNDPSLATFTDVGVLAKSYVNAQKLIGKDKIPVPDKFATDDDWAGVFKKLGLPEDPKEYQVDVEKDAGLDESFLSQFKENAYKAGVLPKQAKKLLDWYTKASKETLDAHRKDMETKQAQVEESLKKEWGMAYDKNMLAASLVTKDFGDQETQEFLSKATLADGIKLEKHPAFLKLMSKIGQSLKEESLKGDPQGRGDPNILDPQSAQSEINKIMGDFKHPYYDQNHPNHKAAVDEVQRLWSMAVPNKK